DGLTSSLLTTLQQRSNLRIPPGEALEIVLGVPAHANSNQSFLSVESFRTAGFQVLGVLNEPSAASIEFGHRQRQSRSSPEIILVYDLGGGTFDASLVTLDENVHRLPKGSRRSAVMTSTRSLPSWRLKLQGSIKGPEKICQRRPGSVCLKSVATRKKRL